MHRAATALAAAGLLAKQLTHHFAGRDACAQGMHVIAVGAAKPVVLTLHGADHARTHRLLAVVQVNEAKHFAAVIHLRAFVFKTPTEGHVPVEPQARLAVHAGSFGRHERRQSLGVSSYRGRPIRKLLIDACSCAYCDVLTHGTTSLTTNFKGPC